MTVPGDFWDDIEVSETAPAGYAGAWRLWPNKPSPLNVGYDHEGPAGDGPHELLLLLVATEIRATEPPGGPQAQ